ncbi:MAG: sugar ABC transporter permease, partial [bacterium]
GELLLLDSPAGDGHEVRVALATGKAALGLVTTADLDAGTLDPDAGKAAGGLQPLSPYLAPVPGAFGPAPLAYATAGFVAVIPQFDRDPVRRRLIWEFYAAATRMGGGVEQAWLSLASARGARIPTVFAARYPGHPLVRALPAEWGPALNAATANALPMPPDMEFERLADALGPRLATLVREGGDAAALLRQAQDEFEESAHMRSRRSSTAWLVGGAAVLFAFAAVLVWGLWRLARDLRSEVRSLGRSAAHRMTPARWGLALALFLPAAGLAAAFGVMPLLHGLGMSGFAHVLRNGGSFVGLANYLEVAISPSAHRAVVNTGLFVALSFFFSYLGPIALALVLSGFRRWQALTRSVFFLPAAASAVVVALLWRQMYEIAGPFNVLMDWLGIARRNWLEEPAFAMAALALAQSWALLGISGLTYLAGLATIPESLYEETEMCGAGLTERFVHVTFPYLKPLLGINLVGWLLSTVRTSELVFLMTGG